MSVTIPIFWQLLADSRLLGREQCQSLAADFAQVKVAAQQTAPQGSAKTLAQWLVSRNVLSKYQATILLAGRAGPFQYGDYKVYDRVDKGRLAGLFRAVHGPTGHPVLLTFMSGPALTDPSQWAAAAANTWSAAAIVSPHVQRWFEPVDAQVYKFVVSEDLRGPTAEERMAGSRFPPAEACRMARAAALGLAQLHQAGRVHGDVRPTNLLLEPIAGQAAQVKLLWNAYEGAGPWNLAEDPPSPRLALAADFLAPELAAPDCPPDALTDLYALGCTLYTMLAGTPPFVGGSIVEKMARHRTEPIRPLEPFGVPQPLAQLVAYLMAKNPAVRYQAAALVAEQLAVFVEPAALQAQPAPAAPTLPGFEAFLRQKQPSAPAPPAHMPAPAEFEPAFPVLRPRRKTLDLDLFSAGPAAGPAVSLFDPAAFQPLPPTTPQPIGPSHIAASSATATSGFSLDVSSSAAKASGVAPLARSAATKQRPARRQRNQLVSAIGVIAACVVVAIGSVVVLVNSNLFREPGGEQIATTEPGKTPDPGEVPPPEPSVEKGSGQTAVTPASSDAGGTKPAAAQPSATPPDSPSTPTPVPTPAPSDGGLAQEIVLDDSKLLWASPTTGRPISERLIPPEPQVLLFVRPADMLASGEGAKVLQALGPAFVAQQSAWEKAAGFRLPEIEQLLITLHSNEAQFPRASFVVRTKAELPPDQLLTRWNGPIPMQEGTATYYLGGGRAYYISPSEGDARTFVMGEERDVKEVVKSAGNPPPLGVPLRRILRTTDSLRHVTIVAIPQFFANDDGEPLFAGERVKVRQPLAWLLGDNLQVAAVSLHFGSELYFELRMVGTLDKEPILLSSEVKSRLAQVPGEIENYVLGLTPPPYWKKLSFRYPAMVRQFHEHLRVGVENDQAVINAVLPGVAAHNLVLGGELMIASAPGSGEIAAVANPMPTKALPKTLDEALQLKTTFTFAQQSLEFAMRDLEADAQDQIKGSNIDFRIRIIGEDLEKGGGITRNQSIRDFQQQDKTFAEILTALVLKGNPITTVKSPAETDQKLIWVIGPDPDDTAKQIILITSRDAAAAKKYTLPPVFVAKEEGKKKGK